MSDAEGLLHRMSALVDQPLVMVNSRLEVVEANHAFCETLAAGANEIIGAHLFDLPDGHWNGPDLRHLIAERSERELPRDAVLGTEDLSWTLGSFEESTVRVKACRVGNAKEATSDLWLLTLVERSAPCSRPPITEDMAALLHQAISLAASTDYLQQALQFCIRAICEITGWPVGHVFVTPRDDSGPLKSTDLWRLLPQWDITRLRQQSEHIAFHAGTGLPGEVWQSKQILWIEDLNNQDSTSGTTLVRQNSLEELHIEAAIGIPLFVEGRLRAVLEFFNTRATPRSPEIAMFCTHMADSVGTVIQHQEATERVREVKDASSRAERQFLANISHELRTPMTAVLGMLQLSLQERLPRPLRDYLQTAQGSANELLSLLNDILDFAGLESGKLTVVSEPFSLRDLLEQMATPHFALAHAKGLQWNVSIQPEVPDHLIGDSVRLRQVVDHLLDNAIKFTEQGSVAMRVSLEKQNSAKQVSLRFCISDTGPGLSQDDQERMLEGFTQVDSTFTRRHGGAGLGLAICRALVDRMRGNLSLESQAGEGCTIQFTVPFSLDFDRANETGPIGPHDSTLSEDRLSEAERSLSILLAEDTPANQKVIGSILRKRGHTVTMAASGREALEHVAKSRFCVILMDLQMPVMDGYQATAAIRELERRSGKHTPIIALTAHSTDLDRAACLEAGMDAYLAKPIDVHELTATVESTAAAEAARGTGNPTLRSSHTGQPRSDVSGNHCFDRKATMKRLGGDDDLFREFIEVFQEDSPRMLDAIRSAILADDGVAVARAAHGMRGLASNFGATAVVETATLLENAGNRNDLGDAPEVLDRLTRSVAQLIAAFEPYRTS
jgi:signal transduction histidine kinase/CheY-like chemotaxis protein/HPt (histidine-containing phosphotransfer) domain-containing protein